MCVLDQQRGGVYMEKEIAALGFKITTLHKGGLLIDAGGEGNPLLITAHGGKSVKGAQTHDGRRGGYKGRYPGAETGMPGYT